MPRIRVDLRFTEIRYELWALGEVLKTIEPQLRNLRLEDHERTSSALMRIDDPGEWQDEMREFVERTDYVLPRFVRGPYIVSLVASYESAVYELARYAQHDRKAPLAMTDLRGEPLLDRAEKYFGLYLGIPLDDDADRLERLRDLYSLRNLLAHANGLVRGLTKEGAKRLERLKSKYSTITVERDAVMLAPAHLSQAHLDVNNSLVKLILRVGGKPSVQTGGQEA
jgi:hypothetical protein